MNKLEDGMSGDALKQLLQAYMSQTNVNGTSDGGLVMCHPAGAWSCCVYMRCVCALRMCAVGVCARALCFLGIEIEKDEAARKS